MPEAGAPAVLSEETIVRADPLARLQRVEDGWLLTRTGDRSGYRIDVFTAAVMARSSAPVAVKTLQASLAEYGPRRRVLRSLRLLLDAGFLVPEAGAAHRELRAELAEWRSAGWEAAAGYHFQTYGYTFETYQPDGSSAEDTRRMHAYAAERRDHDRGKAYGAAAPETRELPVPEAAVAPGSLNGTGEEGGRPLTAQRLTALLSLLACPVATAPLPWPGAAPVLLKTSPSGGSRHPTEVYVRCHGVPGLGDGWWHVASQQRSLERITGPDSGGREGSTPEALVVYTCLFARNRYRYREPRTFRTVHMDVGHLMGTCEVLAASHGLAATPVTRIDTRGIATALGLEPLVESPVAATLLTGGAAR